MPTCLIGYISSEYHASKYWNTHTHTKSTDLYSNYTTVDPKQLHRSHMKFRRQAQKGGHIIPDKADTLRKHLEPQTVSCLGKKNAMFQEQNYTTVDPNKKTLAEIAPKKIAPWKINMVHLQITHWKKGKWSEPNLHCPTPGLSHFCSINPWRVCSRTALALWCLPPVATQR